MLINDIRAISILDSRGNPTVEVMIVAENGNIFASASVPSGASVGTFEAHELRDKEKAFLGKGVENAVNNVNTFIRNEIIGKKFDSIESFDNLLIQIDGTQNKQKLGANAILGSSIAFTKALAIANNQNFYSFINSSFGSKMHTPVPFMNVINGGKHADNMINIQEFMILPVCGENFRDSLRCGVEIYHAIGKILKKKGLSTNVGDEGGYAPNLQNETQALDIITSGIEDAGYIVGKDVLLALDVAATEFYENNMYEIYPDNKLSAQEMIEFYEKLIQKYPIFSIEDPLHETDYDGFKVLTEKIGKKVQIVGDDLFVTNHKLLENGIKQNIANSILIKPNQIGTISETLNVVKLAKKRDYSYIISHRSGETEDTTIAHLAIGLDSLQIKTGAPCRTDRNAKYNEILRIDSYSETKIPFGGSKILSRFNKFSS